MSVTNTHSFHLLSWILSSTLGLLDLNRIPVLQTFSDPYVSTSERFPWAHHPLPYYDATTQCCPPKFLPHPSNGTPFTALSTHKDSIKDPILKGNCFDHTSLKDSAFSVSCCVAIMWYSGIITKTLSCLPWRNTETGQRKLKKWSRFRKATHLKSPLSWVK